MGRTNPTFRDVLRQYRSDWDAFRRGLRTEHADAFDALFDDAAAHADAAGYMNAREPMHPILVSMLLAQKRQIRGLEDRVAELEATLDGSAAGDVAAGDRTGDAGDHGGDAGGVATRTAAEALTDRIRSDREATGDDAV